MPTADGRHIEHQGQMLGVRPTLTLTLTLILNLTLTLTQTTPKHALVQVRHDLRANIGSTGADGRAAGRSHHRVLAHIQRLFDCPTLGATMARMNQVRVPFVPCQLDCQ